MSLVEPTPSPVDGPLGHIDFHYVLRLNSIRPIRCTFDRANVIAHLAHCYCYARHNRVIMAQGEKQIKGKYSGIFLKEVTQGGADHEFLGLT